MYQILFLFSFFLNQFNEDLGMETNGEAILFVHESIKLDESGNYSKVKFVKGKIFRNEKITKAEINLLLILDASNSCRYFATHSTGVHSVYLPWLENLKDLYKNESKQGQNIQCIYGTPKIINLHLFLYKASQFSYYKKYNLTHWPIITDKIRVVKILIDFSSSFCLNFRNFKRNFNFTLILIIKFNKSSKYRLHSGLYLKNKQKKMIK